MKNIIRKTAFLILLLSIVVVKAQLYPTGLSTGRMVVESKEIPVQIFSTTDIPAFIDFAQKEHSNSVLVILNDVVKAYAPGEVLTTYTSNGYQLLDDRMQVLPAANASAPQTVKYLYHPSGPAEVITPDKTAELRTPFTIWDPSTGINLGPITLHYYSLMFILAFGLGYFLMSKIFQRDRVHQKYLEPLFTWTLLGTILGARLGHVIFYQPELFKQDFFSVFLPIQTQPEFKFTGFSGLASHGAAIALIFTTLYYAYKIIGKNPFWVYDRIGVVVALGGAFVRIGNFFNSEIIGKPVHQDSPLAVLFPQMSSEYGLTVPRYPTQLLEAGGYFLLFIALWFLYRYTNKKYQQGWLFGLFFIVLWSIRLLVEFLKEPQGEEFIGFLGLNTGQVLSLPFIVAGVIIMITSKNRKISPEENSKPE